MKIKQEGSLTTGTYSWTLDNYLLLHIESIENLAMAQDIRDALEFTYQKGKKDRTKEIIEIIEILEKSYES